jgi:serine/threonine protein kinase
MMKKFDHINVLQLRGISFDEDDMPLILLPFMAGGDLLSHIRDEKNRLTIKQLLHFSLGIAEGITVIKISLAKFTANF